MVDDNINVNTQAPNVIAFIIDNEVVEVIGTEDRIAAIWLSNPTIVDITGEHGGQIAFVGDTYHPETQTFTANNVDQRLFYGMTDEEVAPESQ
jgi:hypothetical protein